jgi:hypothetical protein
VEPGSDRPPAQAGPFRTTRVPLGVDQSRRVSVSHGLQRLAVPLLCLALHSASLGAQSPEVQPPHDRFFSADSVADALVGYLQFRRGVGLTSPVVQVCDSLATDEVLTRMRTRLDPADWPELSRAESCERRPFRLDSEGVKYVLGIGPISFSEAGATIVALRWHLRSRQPEIATVSRQWWRTIELRFLTPLHSTLLPRQPPRD